MPEQEQKVPSPQKVSPLWWVRACRLIWKIAVGIGSVAIFGVVVNIFSTWLTSPQGIIPANSPTIWLLHQWPLTLLVSGFLFFLALLSRIVSRWPSHHLTESSPMLETLPLQQNRDRILGRLHRTYDEWFAHSLQGVAPIDLGLAEKPDALHNARTLLFRSSDQPERPLPVGIGILDVYDLAEHELLILGEPGAGKSTLLQLLATQLVTRAESDPAHPLPVLLPLASWASKRLPLQDWMTEQLMYIYSIPPQLSTQWIEADMLLPLLDGLDEVDPTARLACIGTINAFHLERFAVPLVISSRKSDYELAAIKRRLVLQRAIVVQPLTTKQIDTTLAVGGKPLAALRSALKKNPTLQELATTPLMLSVLMITYQGITVRTLSLQGSQLQQQIWEDYVQRMIMSRGDAVLYPLDVTKRWLGWLAREMRQHNLTTFSLMQLQPDWLPGRYGWFYWAIYRFIGGLLLGLCGLLLGLAGHQALSLSLSIGGSAGLLFALLSRQSAQKEPVAATSRSPWNLRQNVFNGVVLGLACTLCLVLFSHSLDTISFLLYIVLGLLGGVLVGVLFWLVNKPSREWLTEEPTGLLNEFSRGFNTAVQYYVLRFWLWRMDTFPWEAKAFLDDCTTRILLQRVKGEYSFTHRLLLDYFADLYQ
jgi:hypothetical protein